MQDTKPTDKFRNERKKYLKDRINKFATNRTRRAEACIEEEMNWRGATTYLDW
jgi:hypothetical protein